ncbi:hypothetical protein BH11PSE4_BH11PSE4_20300 [soil metagenome]
MSTCTHESMTNNHADGVIRQLIDVVHIWRERQHSRRELLHWDVRDMRDAGVSPDDARYEAAKPFWQA